MIDLSKAMQGDKFFTAFYQFLTEEITAKSHEIIERHKKEIETELESMRQSIIAGAAVRLSHIVRIETMGTELVIRIEKSDND